MITRRHLLQAGIAATTLGRWPSVSAAVAGSDYRALVCVFLFGGNDANNLIVPLDSARFGAYTNIRKALALDQKSMQAVDTPAGPFGFHPKLAACKPLFDSKNLAVVVNVGTLVAPLTRAQYLAKEATLPANLFSHSDQQAQWQTSASNSNATTGWGGRLADQLRGLNGPSTFPMFVSVAGNTILGTGQHTRGGTVTPGAPLGLQGYDNSTGASARMTSLLEVLTMTSGAKLMQQASSIMSNGLGDAATLNKALAGAPALQTQFPTGNSLATQLLQIARLIQVRQSLGLSRQIFFASLGGFDTHSNQLADQDRLFSLLGPALEAFYNATVELDVASQVTTFTESDFARTFQPNTNGGTDHAWGSHQLVLGGAVQGGQIAGKFPSFELNSSDDAGSEGRWIPSTSVDQYGATLAQWLGAGSNDLDAVFPNLANFPVRTLPLFG
ncbi:MAG: DUF1501 domain-containing protein [Bryobacterales bacterium]|nr:DUF1501 domain-containing protein [Bryobacterales bacterium]